MSGQCSNLDPELQKTLPKNEKGIHSEKRRSYITAIKPTFVATNLGGFHGCFLLNQSEI